MNIIDWPEVPKDQRPKRLPIDLSLTEVELAGLLTKGWAPVDVRLMPNESDMDRAEAVKAWLEGVRIGTVLPDIQKLKHVELEAAIYGIKNSKGPSTVKQSVETELDVAKLLDFNSNRAFRGTWNAGNNQLKGPVDVAVARVEAPKPVRAAKRKVPALRLGTPPHND